MENVIYNEGLIDNFSHHDFTIKSGHVLFGQWNNVIHGHDACTIHSANVTDTLASESKPSGTVIRKHLDYNIPAEIGTWSVYMLKGKTGGTTRGYLLSHQLSYPTHESCANLLKLIDDIAPIDVLVPIREAEIGIIGRYDWDYYDHRGKSNTDENSYYFSSPTCFFVDVEKYNEVFIPFYQQGKQIEQNINENYDESKYDDPWSCIEDRRNMHQGVSKMGEYGICMSINGEYMHGRYIINQNHNRICAFLFFDHYLPETFCTMTIGDDPVCTDDETGWSSRFARQQIISAAQNNNSSKMERILKSGVHLENIGKLFNSIRNIGKRNDKNFFNIEVKSHNDIAFLLAETINQNFNHILDSFPLITSNHTEDELHKFMNIFVNLPLDFNALWLESQMMRGPTPQKRMSKKGNILIYYIQFNNFDMVKELALNYGACLNKAFEFMLPFDNNIKMVNTVDYFMEKYAIFIAEIKQRNFHEEEEITRYEDMWLWIKNRNVEPIYFVQDILVEANAKLLLTGRLWGVGTFRNEPFEDAVFQNLVKLKNGENLN